MSKDLFEVSKINIEPKRNYSAEQWKRKKLSFEAEKNGKHVGIIYKFTNKINNKSYIGQTTWSLKERVSRHLHYNQCKKLYRAIKKYGIENFEIETIYNAFSLDDLNVKETYFIHYFDCLNNGYNLKISGKNGYFSEEIKEKIRQSKIGEKNPRFGKAPWNKGKKLHYIVGQAQAVLCLETNMIFASKLDAAKFFNVSPYYIDNALTKKRFNNFKYTFKYV